VEHDITSLDLTGAPAAKPNSSGNPSKTLSPELVLNREYVRMKGNYAQRSFFHNAALYIKKSTMDERRRLAEEYIRQYAGTELDIGVEIDRTKGYADADLSDREDVRAVLREANEVIAKKAAAATSTKGSLLFIASSKKDFPPSSKLAQFVLSPLLVLPVTRYFGVLPILFSFGINRADSSDLLLSSSHMHHIDPEDTTQIKVFVYLVDVDEETRPFAALAADLSDQVRIARNYTSQRLTDEQVSEIVGPGRDKRFLGPAGATVFCDTNRCFHYGGRPGRNIRDMLSISYSLPTSTWFPLWPGDGERRDLTAVLRPRKDDPFDKALLGHELIA
jgi:hypothetical protein